AAVNDLRFLYEGQTISSQVSAAVVRELRTMDPADVQALADVLPSPEWQGLLIDAADALRAAPGNSPADAIPFAVKKTFDHRIKPILESSLRSLLPPPPPPGQQRRPRNPGGL